MPGAFVFEPEGFAEHRFEPPVPIRDAHAACRPGVALFQVPLMAGGLRRCPAGNAWAARRPRAVRHPSIPHPLQKTLSSPSARCGVGGPMVSLPVSILHARGGRSKQGYEGIVVS
jgi:hypothetical protein